MNPAYWTMLGLAIDIVGAFLLSAEAIKVENLIRMRRKMVVPIRDESVSALRKTFSKEGFDPKGRAGWVVLLLPWVVIIPTMFILIGTYTNSVASDPPENNRAALVAFLQMVAGLALLLVVCALIVPATFLAIAIIGYVGIVVVDFIDRHTPDGGCGIIGFLLLMSGFMLQFYGTYAGMK